MMGVKSTDEIYVLHFGPLSTRNEKEKTLQASPLVINSEAVATKCAK